MLKPNRFKVDPIGEVKKQPLGLTKGWVCERCGVAFYQRYRAKYCRNCRYI